MVPLGTPTDANFLLLKADCGLNATMQPVLLSSNLCHDGVGSAGSLAQGPPWCLLSFGLLCKMGDSAHLVDVGCESCSDPLRVLFYRYQRLFWRKGLSLLRRVPVLSGDWHQHVKYFIWMLTMQE